MLVESNRRLVPFTRTNESLDAVLVGLDVQSNDDILAVAGSGEQAFAMVSRGARVTAVDINKRQIFYVRSRLAALALGFTGYFISGIEPCFAEQELFGFKHAKATKFFDAPTMRAIWSNKFRLTLSADDIFLPALPGKKYDKVYLSNALLFSSWHYDSYEPLANIANRLAPNGLVHATNGSLLTDIPCCYTIDERLTELARFHEKKDSCNDIDAWQPTIFRMGV